MISFKDTLIKKVKQGFNKLPFSNNLSNNALKHITLWLFDNMFQLYVPYIIRMIEKKEWHLLLDSFYRIIPFGTGGRRGLIGIGPNRINLDQNRVNPGEIGSFTFWVKAGNEIDSYKAQTSAQNDQANTQIKLFEAQTKRGDMQINAALLILAISHFGYNQDTLKTQFIKEKLEWLGISPNNFGRSMNSIKGKIIPKGKPRSNEFSYKITLIGLEEAKKIINNL